MTTFLALSTPASFPSSPAFLVASPDPVGHVNRVIKAILKARRIVVVCGEQHLFPPGRILMDGVGAGISVQAGIPDFRSSEGLFQSLKRDNPTLTSGIDLFDASIFRVSDISLRYRNLAVVGDPRGRTLEANTTRTFQTRFCLVPLGTRLGRYPDNPATAAAVPHTS